MFAYDRDVPDEAYVAWVTDDGPWLYVRSDVMRGNAAVWTTERATSSGVSPGATVVYFDRGQSLPDNESAALNGTWRVGRVASVDTRAGTLRLDTGDDIRIVAARVVR